MSGSPFDFDWLAEHAAATPAAPFLGSPSTLWLDYAAVHARVQALAAALHASGVTPGSRVVVSLPQVPAAAIATLAVHSLGAVAVELDRERSDASLAAVLEQTRPVIGLVLGRDARRWPAPLRLLVLHPRREPKLAELLGARLAGWLTDGGETDAPAGPPAPSTPRDAAALAQLVFTSGTTAAPRGVMLSHQNLAANTASILAALPIDAASRAMLILPLFHVFGRSVLLSHLRAGGSVWLDDRFMFPRVVLEELARQRCTHFAGVPLTFELLKSHAGVLDGLDLGALTTVLQAGGALSPATARWARQAFAPAKLYVMYGQTEATARLCVLQPADAEREGSIGRAIAGVTLKIVDDAGAEVPPGVVGNLVARGDNVMLGYLDSPAETREVLRDGWLWTGDLARRDEAGFLYIAGRTREMMKLGGHRVSPAELEAVLCSHPAVREAAVTAERDDTGAEHAVAWVVARGAAVEPADLLRHCRSQLAPALVPKRVELIDALPRTSTGKLARHLLKKGSTP